MTLGHISTRLQNWV